MRKIIISMLLASAMAAPAAAQRQHSWGDDNQTRSESREARQQAREEQQQAREESRQSRQEQVQSRQEAQQQARSEALAARTQTSERNVSLRGDANQSGARAHAEGRASRADLEAVRAARLAQSQSADTTHQWSSPEAEQRNLPILRRRLEIEDRTALAIDDLAGEDETAGIDLGGAGGVRRAQIVRRDDQAVGAAGPDPRQRNGTAARAREHVPREAVHHQRRDTSALSDRHALP